MPIDTASERCGINQEMHSSGEDTVRDLELSSKIQKKGKGHTVLKVLVKIFLNYPVL